MKGAEPPKGHVLLPFLFLLLVADIFPDGVLVQSYCACIISTSPEIPYEVLFVPQKLPMNPDPKLQYLTHTTTKGLVDCNQLILSICFREDKEGIKLNFGSVCVDIALSTIYGLINDLGRTSSETKVLHIIPDGNSIPNISLG